MKKEQKLIRAALARLAEPDARLQQISSEEWGVFTAGSAAGKPSLKLQVSQILALRSSDLIRIERDGSARLTEAGKSWCVRQGTQLDPFMAQHQKRGIEHFRDADGQLESVTVNKMESPLSWLRNRKDKSGAPLLSERQFLAGERLRRDFTLGHLQPKTTASWSFASGQASHHRRYGARTNNEQTSTEASLAARERFNSAVAAVGPELADPLIEVCCFLRGVEETESKFAWPKRSGKLVLRLALSALARHYDENTSGSSRPSGISARLEDGFRPAMFQED